jgi:DUF1365 family protein
MHEFAYRIFMVSLDLAEIDSVFESRWFWSSRRPAIARFCREDHFGDPVVPLDEAVRSLVQERTGRRPNGPIRVLTQLRYFGYYFNPVGFYYCFDTRGENVETIVAEVNNTPWGEQHCYVLHEAMNRGDAIHKRYGPNKEMHVSPFMPMEVDYDWRFSPPADRLTIHMENAIENNKIFDATLDLERTELSTNALARVLITYPFMTLKVIVGIYWEALRLWLKRVPVYDHPAGAATRTRTTQ